MKKLLSFLFLGLLFAFTSQIYAQETIVFSENFNAFVEGSPNNQASSSDVSGRLDEFTQQPGWTGSKVYQAGGAIKLGTSSIVGWVQLPTLDLSANGGTFVIRFKSMAWSGDKKQVKVIVNGNEHIVGDLNNDASYTFSEFQLMATGGTTNTIIKFEGLNADKGRFFLEDLTISTFSGALVAYDPISLDFGDITENNNVTLPVTATGFNLTGTNYTVAVNGAGFSSTITTISKAQLTSGISIPIELTTTSAGNYTGTLSITGSDISSPATCNLSAHCVSVIQVSTIAELRSKLSISDTTTQVQDNVIYHFTGNAIVTSASSYSYLYRTIQDETGAIMIYDNGGAFVGPIEKGQEITDVYGTLINYYGLLELAPAVQTPTIVSPFGDEDAIKPLIVTFDDMNNFAYMIEHQSEVIELDNVKFASAGTFENAFNIKYLLTNGIVTDELVLAFYRDADYIGTAIPQGYRDISGICHMTRGKHYIIPRSLEDYVNINDVNIENKISIYPNPVNNQLFIKGLQSNVVEFYDVLGNLVKTIENPSNTISIENFASGIYFVKFTTNEGVAVKKIVKQ